MKLPVLEWLPRYDRRWLRRDVLAGLTVWALAVPESMAYAGIAGVPVQYGLYAIPLALVAYVALGSCRQLFVGPSATVASISAVAVAAAGSGTQSANEMIALTAILALIVGAVYLLLGLLRFGFVARFFARPVLDGFIIGLGLYIAIGQLPKLVGISKPSGDTIAIFVRTLGEIGDWEWAAVAVGVVSLASLFAIARLAPRAPGALIVAAASILAVGAGDLGVEVVGEVPTGFQFAPMSGVGWSEIERLIPGALAIVVVGFAQSVAIAKAYGAKHGYRIDANQELIGYGAANLGAGLLQGFTVTGSLSKSAAAEDAGGRSPVLLLVSAVLVVLTILVLAGLFEQLPEATLAAIVIHAVSGMIDASKLARLWRAHRDEFALAAGAMAGVLVIGIFAGVAIGVALSFALLIHRIDVPRVARLGRSPDGSRFEDLAVHPGAVAVPGVLVCRVQAPLIFANALTVSDEIMAAVEDTAPPPRIVILDLENVPDVDSTGSAALSSLGGMLAQRGIALRLSHATARVRDLLDRDDVLPAIGQETLFPTVRDAVAATRRRGP